MDTSHPSVSADCPFCEIVDGDDPDVREVYRETYIVAFAPTEPAALGHTLLVPRRHIVDIWGLDEVTAHNLAGGTIRLAAAIKRALHPDGLNVIQSNGKAATQTVEHLHIHLVPRWHNDRIGRIWPPEANYTEDQKEDTYDAIRASVDRSTQSITPTSTK